MTDIFLVASTVSWAVFGTFVAHLQKSVDTTFPPKERGIASFPCKGGITFFRKEAGGDWMVHLKNRDFSKCIGFM